MAEKLNPDETVSLEELVVSGIYTQEAMVNLLVRKGLITKQEIIDEINRLRQEAHDKTSNQG